MIVKINRGELNGEVRGERDGGWGYSQDENGGRGNETSQRRVTVDLVAAPKARGGKFWRLPTFMIKVHHPGSATWRRRAPQPG